MFESVTDAVEFLEARHKPGRHVYRGQELRYPLHSYVDENGSQLALESCYPRDYRFVVEYGRHDPRLMDKLRETRGAARARRDRFVRFLVPRLVAARNAGGPGAAWLEPYAADLERAAAEGGLPSDGDAALTRLAWSLAQYYDRSSALLDVTGEPRIAAWFATRPWDETGTFQAIGNGVIYRFDLPRLERLVAEAQDAEGPCPGFYQSLEQVPASFAARPAAQRGGSVCGFDHIPVVCRAFEERIAEPFEFRHSGVAAHLGVSRSTLVPKDDPFLPVVRELGKQR